MKHGPNRLTPYLRLMTTASPATGIYHGIMLKEQRT